MALTAAAANIYWLAFIIMMTYFVDVAPLLPSVVSSFETIHLSCGHQFMGLRGQYYNNIINQIVNILFPKTFALICTFQLLFISLI
jgi:hypothetical protein